MRPKMSAADELSNLRAALHASEERFRRTFQASPMIMAISSLRTGRFVEVNESFERISGFSRHDAIGRDPVELGLWLDPQQRAMARQRLAEGERLRNLEARFRNRDGSQLIGLFSAEVVELDGEPCVLTTIADITAVREAEEERSRLLEQERRAREAADRGRLRADFLSEASRLLATSLDFDATLQQVARLYVPTLADGCSIGLLLPDGSARPVAIVRVDAERERTVRLAWERHPPSLAAVGVFSEVLRSGRSVLFEQATDAATREPTDEQQLFRQIGNSSYMVVPLVLRGRVLGAISLATAESGRRLGADDLQLAEQVAERAAVAIENARLYREAQDAIRARDEFLSIAAHELRTPLASVLGYAQQLERDLALGRLDEARLRRSIATLGEGARRLAALANELLDVSRIKLGRLPLALVPLDTGALLERIVQQFQERLDDRHGVELRVPAGSCPIAADPARLEQVVLNLLDNAVKYSPAGGVVELTLEPDGAGCRITVADQGIGLPEGAAERIFEPFERAENAAAHHLPGLGLGLYICRDIVERHGGTISATSAGEGRGTRVSVWLPSAQPER